MAMASPRSSLISPAVIVAGVFGLILAVSVFLPWLTPKGEASSVYDNASGMSVSPILGLTGIAGGLLAVAAAFIPSGGLKKALHILIGLVAVGVLALVIINGTLPLLSSVVRKYISMGFGLYLYAFAGLALVFLGLTEKSRSSQIPRQQWASPQPVPQYAGQGWTPPPPVMPQYTQPAAYAQPAPPPQAYGRPCGNCGQAVKPGVSFCASCGQPVSAAVQPQAAYAPPASPSCPSCGRACSANAAFCPVCGVPIKR